MVGVYLFFTAQALGRNQPDRAAKTLDSDAGSRLCGHGRGKSIVAIRPKPAFQPLFEIATTRAGSGVVLINQTPQTQNEPEASEPCFWWRRGRVGCSLFTNTISCSPAWHMVNHYRDGWTRSSTGDELHQPVNLEAALRVWKAIPAIGEA